MTANHFERKNMVLDCFLEELTQGSDKENNVICACWVNIFMTARLSSKLSTLFWKRHDSRNNVLHHCAHFVNEEWTRHLI